MEEFTLLEIDVEELSFTNTAPAISRRGDGSRGEAPDEREDEGAAETDGAPGGRVGRLLALVVLVAVAVAVAKVLAGGGDAGEDLPPIDEEADDDGDA